MTELKLLIDKCFKDAKTTEQIKNGIKCFSQYDIKEQFPITQYPERVVLGKKFTSQSLKSDKTRAYFVYKALTIKDKKCELSEKPCSSFDPDNSNGKCDFSKEIYSNLWGFKTNYSNFGTIEIFESDCGRDMLWGGDCLNSLQTSINMITGYKNSICLKKMIQNEESFLCQIKTSSVGELFEVIHTPGNFGLFPAYFNSFRGSCGLIKDYLPQSLFYLSIENNEFSTTTQLARYTRKSEYKDEDVVKKIFQDYSPKMFKKYVNTMFLWDLIEYDNNQFCVIDYGGEIISKLNGFNKNDLPDWAKGVERFIKRRGIFMAMLLYAYYYCNEDFKIIKNLLYVDDAIIINGKTGYEGVFELLENKILNKKLLKVISSSKELIIDNS